MPANLIALTMHRCMSSLIGDMFVRGGYTPGKLLIPPADDNKDGFSENLAVVRFNEGWFRQNKTSWREPIIEPERLAFQRAGLIAGAGEVLAQQYPSDRNWLLKDPRYPFTFDDIWRPALREHAPERENRFVVIFRHPASVARSLYARNQLPAVQTYGLYEQTYRRIFDIVKDESPIYVRAESVLARDDALRERLENDFGLSDVYAGIKDGYVTSAGDTPRPLGPLGEIHDELERRYAAQF